MSKNVDYTLADAAALITSINENEAALTAKGMGAEKKTAVTDAYEAAKQKNIYQLKAVKLVNEKTVEQDIAYGVLNQSISKIQNAAKSAFGADKALLKKFRVGDNHPRPVKTLITWGGYFQGLLLEHDDDLTGNGLVAEDIPAYSTSYQNLLGADSTQESAKHNQISATTARDAAVKVLTEEVRKFRNFIKSAFADNKEMQQKFKAIPKGRSGAGGDDTPPPAG